MIRRWLVEPDPELGIVTEQQLVIELAKAATIMDKMGGHLRVTTHRQRSDQVEGEAFTIGAMIEWVDRTDDARVAPEQELSPPVAAAPPEQPIAPPAPMEPVVSPEEPLRRSDAEAAFDAEPAGVIVDGDGQPEEDLTSIPPALR